jgi:hypothetical protein
MTLSGDELAGVVDLFGATTRPELERAVSELAFKRGDDVGADAVDDAIESAVESYHLVAFDDDGETLLAPGPVAFPTLPADAEDLPHILDVESRDVDRASLASTVEKRLRGDAARAAAADDADRIEHLLDVTYDLETWGPVDVSEVRERLDAALAE